MTTRKTNNGALDDTTPRASNNGPLTIQRKSNDLVMDYTTTKTSNKAPLNDAARITNDGPMITS